MLYPAILGVAKHLCHSLHTLSILQQPQALLTLLLLIITVLNVTLTLWDMFLGCGMEAVGFLSSSSQCLAPQRNSAH
jgi:ABC-type uncharacterized transport system permease subunit